MNKDSSGPSRPERSASFPGGDPGASSRRLPAIALALSGVLLLVLARGGQASPSGRGLPLLALLAISELGVILNLASTYQAAPVARAQAHQRLSRVALATACLMAAGLFAWIGREHWPL